MEVLMQTGGRRNILGDVDFLSPLALLSVNIISVELLIKVVYDLR